MGNEFGNYIRVTLVLMELCRVVLFMSEMCVLWSTVVVYLQFISLVCVTYQEINSPAVIFVHYFFLDNCNF
jgi:hypothetical protein